MAAPKSQITVTNVGLFLVITGQHADYAATAIPQYYSLCNIKSIESNYTPAPVNYAYTSKYEVVIHYVDTQGQVAKLAFDIQNVTNQAGWTINQAGLTQAAEDIASWVDACSAAVTLGDIDVNTDGLEGLLQNQQHATNAPYADAHIGTMSLGVRNDNAGTPYGTANGDYTPVSVDANGRIFVNDTSAQDELSTINTRLTPPATYSSSAYEAFSVVSANPANIFYGISGYNSGPGQWIQVHNTVSLPANGAVPIITFYAQASSNFFFNPSEFGMEFATGLTVCNSTTGPTKTIGAADCFFIVQYKV